MLITYKFLKGHKNCGNLELIAVYCAAYIVINVHVICQIEQTNVVVHGILFIQVFKSFKSLPITSSDPIIFISLL